VTFATTTALNDWTKGGLEMKAFLVRLGFGFMLACLVSGLTGCAGRPLQVMTKPSHADFNIAFLPDGAPQPTSMSIAPDDGDAWLLVVRTPGPKDNKVIWQSKKNFKIKFVQIDDQTQPLKPGKELGDEKQGWNEAKQTSDGWEYKLNLKQGGGHGTETVVAKYIVRNDTYNIELDPVIIVGR